MNGYLVDLLLSLPAVLLSLTLHECAHGWVAYRLGDPTAKDLGRLTLNPIRHIDPIGAISLLLFRIGWAKPVPINPRNFKRPRAGMALTAAAGPITNFLIAFVSTFFLLLSYNGGEKIPVTSAVTSFLALFLYYLFRFFYLLQVMNIALALFNLLPLPPLDGSRLLTLILPRRAAFWVVRHERQILIFVLIWMIGGSYLADYLLGIPAVAASPLLSALVSILSLTGWIGNAAKSISAWLISLFIKLPFLA
ncbi:MAG: site-2 protease family protein [Clostridia bacterium]|nr:site-2 protease family protein [Clostridia bacterium]